MWGKVMFVRKLDRVPTGDSWFLVKPNRDDPARNSLNSVDLFSTLPNSVNVTPPSDPQGPQPHDTARDPTSPGKDVAYTVVTRADRLGKPFANSAYHYNHLADRRRYSTTLFGSARRYHASGIARAHARGSEMRSKLSAVNEAKSSLKKRLRVLVNKTSSEPGHPAAKQTKKHYKLVTWSRGGIRRSAKRPARRRIE